MDRNKGRFQRELFLNGKSRVNSSVPPWNDSKSSPFKSIFHYFEKLSEIGQIEYFWFLIASLVDLVSHSFESLEAWRTLVPLCCILYLTLAQNSSKVLEKSAKPPNRDSAKRLKIWSGSRFELYSKDEIIEGDFILLEPGSEIPADILIIAQKLDSESIFVEMSHLLGFPSLQQKLVLDKVKTIVKGEENTFQIENFIGKFKFFDPSPNYFDISGQLKLETHPSAIKISHHNILHEGGLLKSYSEVLGVVIFKGSETCASLSQKNNKSKKIQNDLFLRRLLKKDIKTVGGILFLSLLIRYFIIQDVRFEKQHGYLFVFSNCFPIALPLVMIILRYIEKNFGLEAEGLKVLNVKHYENLAHCKYLLMDKSGILTENTKKVKFCFVDQFKLQDPQILIEFDESQFSGFEDIKEIKNIIEKTHSEQIDHLIKAICLCNTFTLVGKNFCGNSDDMCLMKIVELAGLRLEILKPKRFNIYYGENMKAFKRIAVYSGDHGLFVFVRNYAENNGYLYMKGTGETFLKYFDFDTKEEIEKQIKFLKKANVNYYGFGFKEFSRIEMKGYLSKFKILKNSLVNSDQKVCDIFEKLAVDIKFLGVVGFLEPRKENIADSLQSLQKMGVNVWITSSDDILNTYTTAKCLGLLKDTVKLINIKKESSFIDQISKSITQKLLDKKVNFRLYSKEFRRISTRTQFSNIKRNLNKHLLNLIEVKSKLMNTKKLREKAEAILKKETTGDIEDFSVIIDRNTFLIALKNNECRKLLTVFFSFAKSVIFLHLLPEDKGLVVRLIQENFSSKPAVAVVFKSLGDAYMSLESDCAIALEDSIQEKTSFSDVLVPKASDLPSLFANVYQSESFYVKIIIVLIVKHTINSIMNSILILLTSTSELPSQNLEFTVFVGTVLIIAISDKFFKKRRERLERKPLGKNEMFSIFQADESYSKILTSGVIQGLIVGFSAFYVKDYLGGGEETVRELMHSSSNFLVYIHILTNKYWINSLTAAILAVNHGIILTLNKSDSTKRNSNEILAISMFLTLVTYLSVKIFEFSQKLISEALNRWIFKTTGNKKQLGTFYRQSKVWNFDTLSSTKLLHDFKLNFLSEYTEKKYCGKFIKENLSKIKNRLIIYAILLLSILSFCVTRSSEMFVLLAISSCISLLVILLFYLLTQSIAKRYKLLIELILISAIFTKLVITVALNDPFELGNIVIPTCTFLVQNVMWFEFCIVNLINLTFSVITVVLMYSNTFSISSALILITENLVLLLSIIFSISIQGYFSETLRRNEFILIKKIKNEFYKTSSLLSMLLPSFVKNRVRDGCRYISENKGNVTIIFCDIVDFEKMCKLYEPKELTDFLDKYFSILDKLSEKGGVSKIETVGKTYMACSGLKDSKNDIPLHLRKENHAKLALKFAFAVLEEVSEIEHKNGDVVKVKIGIHSGTVSAGVVGFHKPQFSLVGDTVNTASRMCSTLEDYNSIQISEGTYDMVKDLDEYEFLPKKVEAKGKGSMEVFIVNESCKGLLETHKSLRFSKKIHKGIQLESAFSREKRDSKPLDKGHRHKDRKASLVEKMNLTKIQETPIFRFDVLRDTQTEKDFRTLHLNNHVASVQMILIASVIFHVFSVFSDFVEFFYLDVILDHLPVTLRIFSMFYILGISLSYKKIYSSKYFMFIFTPCIFCMLFTTVSKMVFERKISDQHLTLEIILIIILLVHAGQFYILNNLLLCSFLLLVWIFTLCLHHQFIQNMVNFVMVMAFIVVYLAFKYDSELKERKNFNLRLLADEEIQKNLSIIANLMPQNALANLQNELAYTEKNENVMILFADIVGFTNWSSTKTPNEVIEMLSNLFTRFDKLCVELNVYKVCTIGDCYVVIGYTGEKTRNVKEECFNVIRMGFRMIEVIKQENTVHQSELNMRIGVHIGSVVQGVIGTNIIRFDIWGQDVLIANKMESNGKPGMVKCSQNVKEFLQANGDECVKFEEDKELEIKSLEIHMKKIQQEAEYYESVSKSKNKGSIVTNSKQASNISEKKENYNYRSSYSTDRYQRNSSSNQSATHNSKTNKDYMTTKMNSMNNQNILSSSKQKFIRASTYSSKVGNLNQLEKAKNREKSLEMHSKKIFENRESINFQIILQIIKKA